MPERDEIEVQRGGPEDTARLLALFDDAIAWLVARGQTGQWGEKPFSERVGSFDVKGWPGAILAMAV